MLEKKRFGVSSIIAILMGLMAIVVCIPVLLCVFIPIGKICLEEGWDEALLWLLSKCEKKGKKSLDLE
ncbi:MAG: hypothetical protein N4A57_17110 [Anaeromicrobium sp.]|uniref:hypothetical protein n=1 Tax=Anaeromicrobium sp. TaxID=1929132 RepID=UPI0025DA7403|nr:hypothetical protein [Anaeromicrobium sp.]MCT4595968.1 hypothetical protein [Anaeromicrobium sp.]